MKVNAQPRRERMTVEGFRAVKAKYSDVLTKLGTDGKIDLDRFRRDLAAGRINTTIDTKQQPKHMLTPEWKNQVKSNPDKVHKCRSAYTARFRKDVNGMDWRNRKIEQLQFHRARIQLKDGTVLVGTADCVCDASERDGADIEGLAFDADGEKYGTIILEDDIAQFEILD